eukprot:Skav206188  [mRNA]  locus=scaffold1844:129058:145941:- [translate_table: standard]
MLALLDGCEWSNAARWTTHADRQSALAAALGLRLGMGTGLERVLHDEDKGIGFSRGLSPDGCQTFEMFLPPDTAVQLSNGPLDVMILWAMAWSMGIAGDLGTSWPGIPLGFEWHLGLLELLMFSLIWRFQQSIALASALAYVLNRSVLYIYGAWAKGRLAHTAIINGMLAMTTPPVREPSGLGDGLRASARDTGQLSLMVHQEASWFSGVNQGPSFDLTALEKHMEALMDEKRLGGTSLAPPRTVAVRQLSQAAESAKRSERSEAPKAAGRSHNGRVEAVAEKVEQPLPSKPDVKPTERKEAMLTRKAFVSGFTGFLQRCRPDLLGPVDHGPPAPKSLSEFVDAAASARPPLPAPQQPPSGSLSGPPPGVATGSLSGGLPVGPATKGPPTMPPETKNAGALLGPPETKNAGALLGPPETLKKTGSFMDIPLEKPPVTTPPPPKPQMMGTPQTTAPPTAAPPTTAPPGPPKTAMLPAGAIPPKEAWTKLGDLIRFCLFHDS